MEQMKKLSGWSIERMCWEEIQIEYGHWHIDTPYNNYAGSRYPHSKINYFELSRWVKKLPGFVDVCENEGSNWLDFRKLHKINSLRGKREGCYSSEAVYSQWRE